jgi:RNA polymerase sigma-70 factor (ECF subfamily)
MNSPHTRILYKLANGSRICVEVSTSVKDMLEQSDRKIRSQGRQDRRYLLDFIDGLTDAAMIHTETDAADLVVEMENHRRLYAAVRKLPEIQRRRVLLYFVGNLTHRRIAELEGVNRGTVTRSINRAIKRLYKLLAD